MVAGVDRLLRFPPPSLPSSFRCLHRRPSPPFLYRGILIRSFSAQLLHLAVPTYFERIDVVVMSESRNMPTEFFTLRIVEGNVQNVGWGASSLRSSTACVSLQRMLSENQ